MSKFLANLKTQLKKTLLLGALASMTSLWTLGSAQAVLDVGLDSQGGVSQDECANLDAGLAGALGCTGTDTVLNFTDYNGKLEAPDATGYDPALTENTNAKDFVKSVVNFALSFLGFVTVIIVIYGGILYVTSRGDEGQTETAKKAIQFAVIGIVIILGSYAFVNTILQIGGGAPSGTTQGGNSDGKTITDAGAAFNVDDALKEIEGIASDFVKTYRNHLAITSQIDHLNALEVPLVMQVTVNDATLGGLVDWIGQTLQGNDAQLIDQYTNISETAVNDYLNNLEQGLSEIQSVADPLSDTYEAAQKIHEYLQNGKFSQAPSVERFAANFIPSAEANVTSQNEVDIQEAAKTGKVTGKGCKQIYTNSSNTIPLLETLGTTITDTQVSALDDQICSMIASLQTYENQDYKEELTLLKGRFDDLRALFDMGDKQEIGSDLFDIEQDIKSASTQLDQVTSASVVTVNNATVQNFTRTMNSLYTKVKNIEFVKVRLTASTVEGNAPLLVRFDVLGTEDPSGVTVQNEQIQWDLNGNNQFDEKSEGEDLGATSISKIYDKPGTYRVKVRVLSSDKNIAAGVAAVTLQVAPAKSRVVITAKVGSDLYPIMDYSKTPATKQDSFKITATEAKQAVLFDASKTTDGDGNVDGITYYEWDFGDNQSVSGNAQQAAAPSHMYAKPGAYTVKLGITDKNGVKDTAYFKVYVATPAARILLTPASAPAGSTFTLDGSSSTADVGSISSYQWAVTGDTGKVNLKENNGGVIQAKIDEPGEYKVNLTIQDSSGKPDTASASLIVESQAPKATYTYKVEESNQPSVVTFDARKSYDPDPKDVLTYEWDFGGFINEDYEVLTQSDNKDQVTVRYLKPADYTVVLTVKDQHKGVLQKQDTATSVLKIQSVLDSKLTLMGESARHLDANGEVEVEFNAKSRMATAFQIDYGDGNTDFSDSLSGGKRESTVKFTHVYKQAGVFYATLTALDDAEGKTNDVQRLYIGAGDAPIAVINVAATGEDIGAGPDFVGSTKTKFSFSAADSLNVDGSSKNLVYSWNFGDGSTASQANVTHTFNENNVYQVLMVVKDKNDSTVSGQAAVKITIQNIAPKIHGLTVTPQGNSLSTPLKVNMTVDAEDPDGNLTYVKGWYYDVEDSATPLGTVIAQSTKFTLTVNTKGETGEAKTYGFAAEVKDNANQTVSSLDTLAPESVPTLDVTNGPNDTPIASFSVNKTSTYTGEPILFSSTAYDPDGKIVNYWWDVEGDGFFNNEPTDKGSYEYAYNQVYPQGIQVKLKVEDDAGATAESKPVTIYIDSLAADPDAKFLANMDGTNVEFVNNSVVDTQNGATITGVYWDFDLKTDSDGNGIKDDDFDSFEENPTHKYPDFGKYSVKMTVVDSVGQSDSVTQEINLTNALKPVAAFTAALDGKTATLTNNSTVDLANGVDVRSYQWDFDIEADSNGDGDPANDTDSNIKNPVIQFTDFGTYTVRLTVEDTYGKVDSVDQTLDVKDAQKPLQASLTSVPTPNSLGQVILAKDGDSVSFYFTAEGGTGKGYQFTIDKNIFVDSDGDGVRDNDTDYSTSKPGAWKTSFSTAYAQNVTKLTATDLESEESDVATLQIVFRGQLGGANLFNATPNDLLFLLGGACIAALVGVTLVTRSKDKTALSLHRE